MATPMHIPPLLRCESRFVLIPLGATRWGSFRLCTQTSSLGTYSVPLTTRVRTYALHPGRRHPTQNAVRYRSHPRSVGLAIPTFVSYDRPYRLSNTDGGGLSSHQSSRFGTTIHPYNVAMVHPTSSKLKAIRVPLSLCSPMLRSLATLSFAAVAYAPDPSSGWLSYAIYGARLACTAFRAHRRPSARRRRAHRRPSARGRRAHLRALESRRLQRRSPRTSSPKCRP